MEPIQKQLSKLEESLPQLISEEPYILTPEEEAAIKEYEISQAKKHKAWKMAAAGMKEGQILMKLSEINWEEEVDIQPALIRANSTKHYDRWQKEQREKETREAAEKKEALKKEWKPDKIFSLMSWTSFNGFGKKLIVNDTNKNLITALCFFITRDERLKTQFGFSMNKGLMIAGSSGLGKTHLVKCIEKNPLLPVSVISMLEITERIKEHGEYRLIIDESRIVYLDDVGSEEAQVNYYGTKINWLKDFLEIVYLKKMPFQNLMISTNLNGDDLEKVYGYRVRSRMREMFNVIYVQGEDMRS